MREFILMAKLPKILTIDDEDMVRHLIAEYLEILGYDVIQAENGRIGIEKCRRELPDLVLSDLRMPEVDGLQVLETLTKEFPEMPVILVTGMGGINDAIEAVKLGAWDYITKPFQGISVIQHAVERALERAKLLRENREHREHLEEVNKQLTESLHKLEEDEVAARKMQFNLLPDNSQVRGNYRFNWALYPSRYLSGDFVDHFTLDANHFGFFIADVSGHGVSSALVTILLRSHMHRYVEKYIKGRSDSLDILNPEKTLRNLNHVLLKDDLGKFLTIFYGVLNAQDNTLNYCNGGQFPCPILSDGKQPFYIESNGLPVGLFEEAEYSAHTIELPDRFNLFLFSDGVLEILPQKTIKEKKAHLLELPMDEDLKIEDLTCRLHLEKIDNLPDDIAMLLISRRP
jgi:phosphoserine phosphatase RsbU/P